ncbi:anhydro-N-acetylmuramic acid kinase [Methylophilaceae bacterium]|nr:anhydro-N-acetylmuramic acid kinase [Methylophilaceae bacterium]
MLNSKILIGTMSGTSLDGIDIALTKIHKNKISVLDFLHINYSTKVKENILKLHFPEKNELEKSLLLSNELAILTGKGINRLLLKNSLSAKHIKGIGYHGQTIRHRPDKGYSTQIGNADLLSEITNLTVVSNFRNRDIAAKGQGAPLVPAFHKDLFFSKIKNRVILNIGGISNITYLPTNGSIIGFDCGPGNILMDHWIKLNRNLNFDKNGNWSKKGQVIEDLLKYFLKDKFFNKLPPKSTGRDLFNLDWINKGIKKTYSPEDVQRTLIELTAISITDAIKKNCSGANEIYICGGGAKNVFLIEILKNKIKLSIKTTRDLNLPEQQVEAVAFAWLANKTLNKKFNNSPDVTGAKGFRILGSIHQS